MLGAQKKRLRQESGGAVFVNVCGLVSLVWPGSRGDKKTMRAKVPSLRKGLIPACILRVAGRVAIDDVECHCLGLADRLSTAISTIRRNDSKTAD